MFRKAIHGICIGLGASAVALALWLPGWLNWIEWPTWDWRVRTLAGPSLQTERIRLILLDQTSLDWGQDAMAWSWPWDRTVYSAVTDFCRRGGARAVIFDVLFPTPSRSGVEDDETFGRSIAACTGFVGAAMLSREQGTAQTWPAECRTPAVATGTLAAFAATPAGQRLTLPRAAFPIPAVATNATLLGTVYVEPDSDKVIRRMAPFRIFDGRLIPSLALAGFCAASPPEPVGLSADALTIGSRRIPLDARGEAILRFRGPSQTHKAVSVQAVIQSELLLREGRTPLVAPDTFKDCYVLFGLTAPGLLDIRATPVSPTYSGVELNATLLDNILADDFLRDVPRRMVILTCLLMALLAGMAGRACDKAWQVIVLFAVLLPLPILAGFAAYARGYWLPVAPATVAAGLSLIGVAVVNYAMEGRQKRFLKSAFNHYLNPVVIDRIIENPDRLKLGGETRELTIYFSDVRGFTTISESLTPELLTALLNEYLTAMSDIIMDQGGMVDKYEGDAIIAFWNAPLDLPGHANAGVRSALLCQKKLAEIRPVLKAKYGHEIVCRIGMNTGRVVVGNMGSRLRFNYTFLGDAGNLAARLEGVNKQFGTVFMISEFTARQLSDEFVTRELSRILVVGKTEPVRVFEPWFRADATALQPVFEPFQKGLLCFYEGRFKDALGHFEPLAAHDPPAAAYVRKCRELIDRPPAEWKGAWEMTEK